MEKQKSDSGNMPEKKFSAGAISAAIWKNKGKNKKGEAVEYKTVSIQRAYKNKNDEWQHTNSLRVGDLPRAVLVLNKAYEYLTLREGYDSKEAYPEQEIEVEEIN